MSRNTNVGTDEKMDAALNGKVVAPDGNPEAILLELTLA